MKTTSCKTVNSFYSHNNTKKGEILTKLMRILSKMNMYSKTSLHNIKILLIIKALKIKIMI